MKRKTFIIKLDGVEVGKKHAWNTARRFTTSHLMTELTEGQKAERVSENLEKCEYGLNFVKGEIVWREVETGKIYTYTIEKE